jgi:hypothetical protein
MNKRMKDMSEADREFARQAWVENDWDGYVNLPKLIELVRADERGRMCEQCKECLNEKSTSNEANRPAFLGEGGQAN